MFTNICIFVAFHIVGRISIAESIHKNLIHHRTLCPIRCMIIRIDFKLCPFLQLRTDSLFRVIACSPSILNFKMIPKNLFRHHNLCSIIIKTFCGFVYFHFIFLISGYEIYRIHIILLGSEADYYLFATLWLSRISVIPCSVTEKSLLVKHWSHIQNILHFSCNIFVFLLHCQSSLSVLFILHWKCILHFRVSLSAVYFCGGNAICISRFLGL